MSKPLPMLLLFIFIKAALAKVSLREAKDFTTKSKIMIKDLKKFTFVNKIDEVIFCEISSAIRTIKSINSIQ